MPGQCEQREVRRAEEPWCELEPRNQIELPLLHGSGGLRVIGNRAERLHLECGLASIEHQHRNWGF